MLRQFLGAARVRNSPVRRHDDIGRARIATRRQARRVEHLRNPETPENLADAGNVAFCRSKHPRIRSGPGAKASEFPARLRTRPSATETWVDPGALPAI